MRRGRVSREAPREFRGVAQASFVKHKFLEIGNIVVLFLFVIAKTISILLDVMYFAMIARVILPFFVMPEESRLYALTAVLTEPIIIPFRFLLAKLNVGQNSPLDWSFFVAAIALSILESALPAI